MECPEILHRRDDKTNIETHGSEQEVDTKSEMTTGRELVWLCDSFDFMDCAVLLPHVPSHLFKTVFEMVVESGTINLCPSRLII
jgi:hypothetical protein